jgi:acyl carrier protein
MKNSIAIEKVRACLAMIKPDIDVNTIRPDTPLLEERVIRSFDVLDLILHLEQISGRNISRTQLVPGSFRDMASIARVFLCAEPEQ